MYEDKIRNFYLSRLLELPLFYMCPLVLLVFSFIYWVHKLQWLLYHWVRIQSVKKSRCDLFDWMLMTASKLVIKDSVTVSGKKQSCRSHHFVAVQVSKTDQRNAPFSLYLWKKHGEIISDVDRYTIHIYWLKSYLYNVTIYWLCGPNCSLAITIQV